jgi:hypothetical protein
MRDDFSNGGLDALIDEAARALTATAPPASLRERVAASLRPRRAARVPAWRLLAATAAIVIAAGVVVLWGPQGERDDEAPLTRASGSAADVRLPVTAPPADGGVAVAPSPAPRPAGREAAPAPNSDAAPIVVEPLVLSPISEPDVRALALDSLPAPMPLALEPIVIEPLTLE